MSIFEEFFCKDWAKVNLDEVPDGAVIILERDTCASGLNSALDRGVSVATNGYRLFTNEPFHTGQLKNVNDKCE